MRAHVTKRENETSWRAVNGFLKRNAPDSVNAPEIVAPASPARQQYKRLISDRSFEDILQVRRPSFFPGISSPFTLLMLTYMKACRPRNRGEYGLGLPASLTAIVKTSVSQSNRDRYIKKTTCLDHDSQQLELLGAPRSRYLEWGAVNFDTDYKRLSGLQHTRNRSLSGSQMSSSFSSLGSSGFPSRRQGIPHLQSLSSLEGAGSPVEPRIRFHPGPSSGEHTQATNNRHFDNDEMRKDTNVPASGKDQTYSAIKKYMTEYDKRAFSSFPRDFGGQKIIEDNDVTAKPVLEVKRMVHSKSLAIFPTPKKSGIEAALSQFDVTKQKKHEHDSVPKAGHLENYLVATEEAIGSSSLTVSPLSIGMPYSLDARTEGLRPSAMRLVAPDAIPRAPRLSKAFDSFLPLDSQRKSFRLIQAKTKSRDNMHNQNKLFIQNESFGKSAKDTKLGEQGRSAKESILGERRNSEISKESGSKNSEHNDIVDLKQSRQQKHAPQRTKSHKLHRHSHRRRRKPLVLNPFRQEDEDRVLAKRTHNRRRWSHVFPLGEDEFKRHAGPNWKSLCQPAICE